MSSARVLAGDTGRWTTGETAALPRGLVFAWVLAAYGLFAATYMPINHWSIGRPAHVLFLPGEERIPFIPDFEYLYVLAYFLPLLFVSVVRDWRRLAQASAAFVATLTVAYSTYVFFPVTFERPVFEIDSLATFLLALEYLDPSYNHFPSLHVAISWLAYLAARGRVRRQRLLFWVVVGICLSTLFVKQHYLVDVVYGSILPLLAWRLGERFAAAALGRVGE